MSFDQRIYDCSTAVFAAELSFAHNGIWRDLVTEKRYAAGHMMCMHVAARGRPGLRYS